MKSRNVPIFFCFFGPDENCVHATIVRLVRMRKLSDHAEEILYFVERCFEFLFLGSTCGPVLMLFESLLRFFLFPLFGVMFVIVLLERIIRIIFIRLVVSCTECLGRLFVEKDAFFHLKIAQYLYQFLGTVLQTLIHHTNVFGDVVEFLLGLRNRLFKTSLFFTQRLHFLFGQCGLYWDIRHSKIGT